MFAGRDASRGLATFSLNEEAIKDEWDDLSDLNSMQMDSVREWEMQFLGKRLKMSHGKKVTFMVHTRAKPTYNFHLFMRMST